MAWIQHLPREHQRTQTQSGCVDIKSWQRFRPAHQAVSWSCNQRRLCTCSRVQKWYRLLRWLCRASDICSLPCCLGSPFENTCTHTHRPTDRQTDTQTVKSPQTAYMHRWERQTRLESDWHSEEIWKHGHELLFKGGQLMEMCGGASTWILCLCVVAWVIENHRSQKSLQTISVCLASF